MVALLLDHGGAWQGTAGELLALVPGAAADATRLAVRLGATEGELAAAGITVQRHRKPGTGARMLALRLGEGVTLGDTSLATAPFIEGAGGLITLDMSGGGDVTLPDGAEPPAIATAAEAVGCDAAGYPNVPRARARARAREVDSGKLRM